MNVPYDLLTRWLETNDDFRRFITDTYPTEYEFYIRFSSRNGHHCPIARSAIKRMCGLALHSKDPNNMLLKLLKNEL